MSFFEEVLNGLEEAIEMEGGKRLHKIQKISSKENESLIITFEDGISKIYAVKDLYKILWQSERIENRKIFHNIKVDINGYAVSINEDLVLWADDIWELGSEV